MNLSPLGHLTGYAYAANAGWIQFEQTHGQPGINLLTGQFTGYAFCEAFTLPSPVLFLLH